MRYTHTLDGHSVESWPIPRSPYYVVVYPGGRLERINRPLFEVSYRPAPERRFSERRAKDRASADRRAISRVMTREERLGEWVYGRPPLRLEQRRGEQ